MQEFDHKQRDAVIRTVLAEARPSEEGRASVAWNIRNRLSTGKWGKTPLEVVSAKHQYEGWKNRDRFDENSEDYAMAGAIVDRVFKGEIEDPTKGALNFYAPVAQAQLAKKDGRRLVPKWAEGKEPLAVIDGHEFYNPMFGEADVTPVSFKQGEGENAKEYKVPPISLRGWGGDLQNSFGGQAQPTGKVFLGSRLGQNFLDGIKQGVVLPTLDEVPSAKMFAGMIGAKSYDAGVAQFRDLDKQNISTQITGIASDPNLTPAQKAEQLRGVNVDPPSQTLSEAFVKNNPAFENMPEETKKAIAKRYEDAIRKEQSDQAAYALIDGADFKDVNDSMTKERDWLKEMSKAGIIEAHPTLGEITNLKSYFEYINLKAAEGGPDIDWSEMWEHLKKGEFSPQADKVFTHRYGKEWKTRVIAGLVTELGVDAAVFGAAMLFPPAAAALVATKGATLGARFLAAVARSTLFAATGASFQTIMDAVTNQSRTAMDTLTDFGVRAVLGLGVEGIGAAVSKGLGVGKHGISQGIASARDSLSKRHGVQFYTPEAAADAAKTSSIFKTQMDATAHAYTKEAYTIKKTILEGAPSEAATREGAERLKTIRTELARQFNMTEEQADLAFGLGDKIYGREIFEGLGDKASLDVIDEYSSVVRSNIDLGKAKAKLEARVARLKDPNKIAVAQRQIRDIDGKISANANRMSELDGPYHAAINSYTTGSQIVDAIALGNAVGPRYIGDTISKQKAVDDIFYTYFTPDGKYDFQSAPTIDSQVDPSKLNPFYLTKKFKDWSRSGESGTLPFSQLTGEAGRAQTRTSMARKRLEEMLNSAIGGLDTKASRNVWSAIEEGGEKARIFTPEELTLKGFTPKEADSYYAMRKVFDHAYELEDRRLVREALDKGYDRKWKGMPVQTDSALGNSKGVALTQDMIDQGFVRVNPISKTTSEYQGWQLARVDELKPLSSVLDYEPGYLPIGYKNANWHVSTFDPTTGEISRVAAFRYAREMEDFKKQAMADPKYKDKVILGLEWDDAGNFQSLGMVRSQLPLMEALDAKTYQQLVDNLTAQGIPEAQIKNIGNAKVLADVMDAMTLRRPHVGSRADQRLQGTVELQPSSTATAEYLSHVARQYGFADYRLWATDWWKKQYADVLDPNETNWASSRIFVEQTSANAARIKEARRAQGWLQYALTAKTRHEIYIDNLQKSKEARMAATNSGNALLKVFEKMPYMSQVIHESRGAVAQMRLGLFLPAHLIIQGQQGLMNAFTNPVYFTKGLGDLASITGAAARKATGAPLSQKQKQLEFAFRKNGWLSEMDINDWTGLAETRFNPALSVGSRALQNIKEKSSAPFRAGEGINRVLAFTTARQWALDKLAKEELVDKAGKKYTGLADTEEFLNIVVERAKPIAFDMSRTGSLEAARGAGGVALQFRSIIGKATNIFETSSLTPREKLGAAVGMYTIGGQYGIPLLVDLYSGIQEATWRMFLEQDPTQKYWLQDGVQEMYSGALDWAFETSNGTQFLRDLGYDPNEIKKLVTDFNKKGAPYALSDGNIDLVNRITFGAFIQEGINFANSPMDYVPVLGLAEDIFNAAKQTGRTGLNNTVVLMELMSSQDEVEFSAKYEEILGMTPGEDMLRVWSAWGQSASYPGAMYRYYEMSKDPEALARTTSGNVLPIKGAEVDLKWQLLLGITPGAINAIYEKKERLSALKGLGADFEKRIHDKIKGAQSKKEAIEMTRDADVVWERYIDMLAENGVDTDGMEKKISHKLFNIYLRARVMPDIIPSVK